jgi:hypothetical protein
LSERYVATSFERTTHRRAARPSHKQDRAAGGHLPDKIAPKIQPQPTTTVTDQSIEDRVKRLETKLRFF